MKALVRVAIIVVIVIFAVYTQARERKTYDGFLDEQPLEVQSPAYARIKPSNEPIPLEDTQRKPASLGEVEYVPEPTNDAEGPEQSEDDVKTE